MKTYNVYFAQVNAVLHEVEAENEEEAIVLASEGWTEDNKRPEVEQVVESGQEGEIF